MSRESATAFVNHLQRLSKDLGAMATLRHSLTFPPGDYPRAYPFVERFVARDGHELDARRRARYAVAALFAAHPLGRPQSLAAALGQLMRDKQRPSLEKRFIALLEADADSIMDHLRQAVSLLAADGMGYDHAALLADLEVALDDRAGPERRDKLKRCWALDFYRTLQAEAEPAEQTTQTTE